MPKISLLPPDAAPASSDYIPGVQASVPGTVRFLFSNLANFFWTLANIPSGGTSPITRDNETQFAFVASGMVWSGDSYGVNRNASMTAGVCYINGRRISISAVTARTFTASVDTYIDILDNGDGTGTLVYTTAVNNAASPALVANSLRIGIIVTGVSTIAAAGSVNQGQETIVLPIASSIPYAVTDSLGNLICPRDPNRRLLGYRMITALATTNSLTLVDLVGLSSTVIVPTGRKVRITLKVGENISNLATTSNTTIAVLEDGVQIDDSLSTESANNFSYQQPTGGIIHTPAAAATHTYKMQWKVNASTSTLNASATSPAALIIELY